MTTPMTDAELLEYIGTVPEWAEVDPMLGTKTQVRKAARAFYDHEQRVRGEMQATIDSLMLEYCPEEMTPEQLEEWGKHQKQAPATLTAQIERARKIVATWSPEKRASVQLEGADHALNGSTAPQPSTADQPACIDCAPEFACWGGRIACCKQPVLNSTEQGEAVEAVGLLREVFGAYVLGVEPECDRAALLRRVSDFLAKQGGK